MKKSCKKLLAALLAVTMLFGLVSVVSAEGAADEATALYEGDAYTYFADPATVLPGDAIVAAFSGDSILTFGWGSVFGADSDYNEITNLYAAILVDILSDTDFVAPVVSDEELDELQTEFRNSVASYLGHYEDDLVLSAFTERSRTALFDKYEISEETRAAIDQENLTSEQFRDLVVADEIVNEYFAIVDANIDYLYWNTNGSGNFQTALGILKEVIASAYAKCEYYIYTEKVDKVEKIIANGFAANIAPAYAEIAGLEDFDDSQTVLANIKAVDECAEAYYALDWLVDGVETVIANSVDAAYALLTDAENPDAAAADDVIFRINLYMSSVRTSATVAADFAAAAVTDQQESYAVVRELLANIVVANEYVNDTVDATWAAACAAVAAMTEAGYTGDYADVVELTPYIAGLVIDFSEVGVKAGDLIFITTADHSVSYAQLTVAEDKTVKVEKGLLPGSYGFMAGETVDGGIALISMGEVAVAADGTSSITIEVAQPPVDDNTNTDNNTTSSTPADGDNKGDTPVTSDTNAATNVPKTADNSVVLFAVIICVLAAAAYVVTKKVRG